MKRILKGMALAVAAICTLGGAGTEATAQERKVAAASAWVSQGRYFLTGENEALFVGAMGGVLYVESGPGRLDRAKILCPGDFVIDLNTGAQQGEGKCIVEDGDGDHVFANWTCNGGDFLGCEGDFTITAGTGKFRGISGASELKARTAFAEIVADLRSGKVVEASAGLMSLPELTYTLP